jgi:predicted phage terminase large subunit-like protein
VKGKDYYLLDVFRKRLTYPQLKLAVIEQRKRFPKSVVIIEDKASGTQLIQELKLEGGTLIKPYSPPTGTDKELRVDAQSIHFENGRVFLRRPAPWLTDYIAELTGFPNTKYDDQVDSTIQFLDYISLPGAMPMVITDEMLRRSLTPAPWRR